MDDVVGLVMLQIVSGLGGGSTGISAATVIRPIIVSLAFAVLVPVACRLVVGPLIRVLDHLRDRHADSLVIGKSKTHHTCFIAQTVLLIGLVVAASYAGASVLLAAYLAGIVGAWWDAKAQEATPTAESISTTPDVNSEGTDYSPHRASLTVSDQDPAPTSSEMEVQPRPEVTRITASDIYGLYYRPSIECVLKPFFFVSK
jgi:hypothetical protein